MGKLEALNCVRPGFTNNLIQSYLRRVDETDISGPQVLPKQIERNLNQRSKAMSRRPGLIVWLFAASLIAGSCAITFYTAKLSLDLAAEQENFKRSSISALVQNAALGELSKFEDVVYAAAIKFDAEQASTEMLDRVDWLIQVDQFTYPENPSNLSDQFSLTNPPVPSKWNWTQ